MYTYVKNSTIRDVSGGPEILKDALRWKYEVPNNYIQILDRISL